MVTLRDKRKEADNSSSACAEFRPSRDGRQKKNDVDPLILAVARVLSKIEMQQEAVTRERSQEELSPWLIRRG